LLFLSFSAARLPSLTGEGERALLGDSARLSAESCTTAAACTLAQTVVTSYTAKQHVNVIAQSRQMQKDSMIAALTNEEKRVLIGDRACPAHAPAAAACTLALTRACLVLHTRITEVRYSRGRGPSRGPSRGANEECMLLC